VLILLLIGALPGQSWSFGTSYGPSGLISVVVVIIIVLLLLGRI
jgi:hypothetical protein